MPGAFENRPRTAAPALADALSEALRIAHLAGSVVLAARLPAPWCYGWPEMQAPDATSDRLIPFHLLTDGECVIEIRGGESARLAPGDAILVPHGEPHRLGSAPGLPVETDAPRHAARSGRPLWLERAGPGAVSTVISGNLACDARLAGMLLGGLPSLVRSHVRDAGTACWLESGLRHALAETRVSRAGAPALLGKLAELLFVEVLRRYADAFVAASSVPITSNTSITALTSNALSPPGLPRTGWLAGLNDRVVGSALDALHRRPAHAWTLDELARAASTSRSVLAERFQHMVGSPPMQYLTQWRMMLAASLLTRSNAPLIRIAEDVGYKTDSAFSKAFRREYGAPPAAWRRRQAARGMAGPGV